MKGSIHAAPDDTSLRLALALALENLPEGEGKSEAREALIEAANRSDPFAINALYNTTDLAITTRTQTRDLAGALALASSAAREFKLANEQELGKEARDLMWSIARQLPLDEATRLMNDDPSAFLECSTK